MSTSSSRPGRRAADLTSPLVAVAGCRDLADLDLDWPLLRQALKNARVDARYVAWDEKSVDWGLFDLVVIRSTWDYVARATDFLAWAERVARATKILNSVDVVRWNLNKNYLAELAAGGIAVIATDWVAPRDPWSAPTGQFVVKPSISAGAVETARYRPEDHAEAAAHVHRLQAQGHTVMVQPYMHAIDGEGEIALVFFAGTFSHAARKAALLLAGEGSGSDPMSRLSVTPSTPGPTELALADSVAASVRRRFGHDPLYSRVDLVTGPSGEPLVMEVELIEPNLYLSVVPGSAERLAAVMVAALQPAQAS